MLNQLSHLDSVLVLRCCRQQMMSPITLSRESSFIERHSRRNDSTATCMRTFPPMPETTTRKGRPVPASAPAAVPAPAPAAVTAPVATPAATSAVPSATSAEVLDNLLGVIAEKTGYDR